MIRGETNASGLGLDRPNYRSALAMLHAEPPDLKDPHSIKWRLSYGVAEFCGVPIYRTPRQNGLKCIGIPSDVQFATWLLDPSLTWCSPNCTRI
jgi:hypothetical protein